MASLVFGVWTLVRSFPTVLPTWDSFTFKRFAIYCDWFGGYLIYIKFRFNVPTSLINVVSIVEALIFISSLFRSIWRFFVVDTCGELVLILVYEDHIPMHFSLPFSLSTAYLCVCLCFFFFNSMCVCEWMWLSEYWSS